MDRLSQKFIAPIKRRVLQMVALGRATLFNDRVPVQSVQAVVHHSELVGDMPRVQNYGMTSVPHPGAACVVVAAGGSRTHNLIVAADHPDHRPTGLKDGEVMVYDDQGQCVHLKRGGIEITTSKPITVNASSISMNASEQIIMNAPSIEMKGDVQLGGTGGARVARLGDEVTVTAGSSAGVYKITSAASKVSAS
ncbi:MAG: phage baseplate assembly protein V [Pseudomonadota bacterium]